MFFNLLGQACPITAIVRGREGAKYLIYHPDQVEHELLESLCDSAYMGKVTYRDSDPSYTFTGGGRVIPCSSIGFDGHPDQLGEYIREYRDACFASGLPLIPLGAMVNLIFKSQYKYSLKWTPPPEYRDLLDAAIYPGPMAVVRKREEVSTAEDRTASFFQAFNDRWPIPGTMRVLRASSPEYLLNLTSADGVAEVLLYVNPDIYRDSIAPIPFRVLGGVSWPVGVFWATIPLSVLRHAVTSLGGAVEIMEWGQVIVWSESDRSTPLELRDSILSLPDFLRKKIYVRFWGKMIQGGGWIGLPPGGEPGYKLRGSKLHWHPAPQRGNALYRPDIAIKITANNLIAMNQGVHEIHKAGHRVIAAHIDCLWHTCSIPLLGKGWRAKANGPVSFWGVGIYRHDNGTGWGAMGVRTDSPESPEFEALIKSCKNPKPHIRLYDQGLLKSPIYHAETNNKYNHVDDF